jgi:hypothetical protein
MNFHVFYKNITPQKQNPVKHVIPPTSALGDGCIVEVVWKNSDGGVVVANCISFKIVYI